MEVMPVKTELAKAVTLAYAPHPFGLDRQVMPVLAGITIHQACINAGVDGDQPIVIFLNGLIVPVADWKTKTLNEGDFVTVQAEVTGGGGGGSNPIAVVAMIALAVAAPYALAAMGVGTMTAAGLSIAGSTMLGSLAVAGVMMAGSMVINSIFPPSMPSTNFNGGANTQPSPTYSLSGGSNRMRPYEPMPLIMGTHRFFPDSIMRPYTEYRDQDQWLFQLFGCGLIESALYDFRIGNTPLSSYKSYDMRHGGSARTAFPINVDTQAGFPLTSAAGWIYRTGSDDCYEMQIDVEAIVYYANDSGGMDTNEVAIDIEYRKVGTHAWLSFIEGHRRGAIYREESYDDYGYDEYGNYYGSTGTRSVLVSAAETGSRSTITNSSQKPIRHTYRLNPYSAHSSTGRWEVRIRKATPDSTETRRMNTVSVAAIRSYQSDITNTKYNGYQFVSLVIKASDQLNGAVAQLSCFASSSAQVWNGSVWVKKYTSNPAEWFMDFCRGRYANGRLTYGLGLSNAEIDFTSLGAWAIFCFNEGLTFNAVIDSQKTAADVLQMIARCGFGSPSWSSGKLGVVWDGRMQPPVAVFGMANIIKGSFNVSYLTDQLADEFVVNYTEPEDDYNQAQVRVAINETPTNSVNIDLFGCTNKAMAGKFANYLAAQQIYRRRKVTWETDAEGFVCQRGDVVLLSHDLTQWGYSGRVLAINADTVTLDRTVSSTNGNYLLVRHSDGSLTTHTTSTVGNSSVLTVSPSVVDSAPLDCVYTFSPLATQGKRVKITSIQPINNHRLRIVATDDDPQFYTAWNGTFNTVTKQTLLKDVKPSVSNLQLSEALAYEGGRVVTRLTVRMNWGANTERVRILWRIDGGVKQQFFSYETTALINIGNTAGKLTLDATPFSDLHVGTKQTAELVVYGKTTPPLAVTGFSVLNRNGQALLKWAKSKELDVIHGGRFEIRHATNPLSGWQSARELGQAPGASNSITLAAFSGVYHIRAVDDGGRYGPITSALFTATSQNQYTTLASVNSTTGTKTGLTA